ncbi:hypothetical protein VPH35_080965 [Triticum aestivum]|uniref:uncharacterized protein n=1 Tax=Triticum aestivum TaxID=4565 RepID=UPI0008430FF2|nr:uncharacterized protein LOC123102005 [Triticum aestivum]
MQERCSAGLGAPTSWVRRDGRRRTQGRVDPGAGAQSGPVPAGSTAVLISGEVAGDSRADDDARPREELISWGWGARSCWLRLPVAYAGVAGVQHHGGSSRARKHTATTTLRPAGAPSSRSMVVVNVVGSNAAAVGSIPYRPRGPQAPDERAAVVDRVPVLEAAIRGFADRGTDVVVNPVLGTIFDSMPEVYEFYNLILVAG